MSKGNMLLGHARGKVGSLVFSRSNGQQVVRAKSDVVANPQTRAQMIQRILLNTIAQAYSKMSVICDHSFQGIKNGQDSMSYFLKTNLKNLRARVAQEIDGGAYMDEIFSMSPLGTNVFVPNNYVISKGTLPKITVADASADDVMKVALDGNTYGDFINKYGLKRGDQVTFVAIQGESADNLGFAYARVILDPRDENDDQLPLTTTLIQDNAIVSPNKRNEGSFETLAFDTDHVNFGFGATFMVGGAIIVSRKKEDDSWERSDATIVANTSSSERVYSLGYALELLETGGIGVESSRYLNNAGRNRTAELSGVHPTGIASMSIAGQSVEKGGTANVNAGSIEFSGVVESPEADLKVGLQFVSGTGSSQNIASVNATTGEIPATTKTVAGTATYKVILYKGDIDDPDVIDIYCTVVATSVLPGG